MADAFYRKSNLEKAYPRKDAQTNMQNYEHLRSDLQTGDLLFFSGDHWISSLIRVRSRSAWSHLGFVIKIEEMDRVFLVESVLETGVRMIPMSNVFKDYDGQNEPYGGRIAWARYRSIADSEEKKQKIKEFCLDNLSKQYDHSEYYRMLWRTFIGLREIFEDNKYTCAELVRSAFLYADLLPPKERSYFISPGAFWRLPGMDVMRILI